MTIGASTLLQKYGSPLMVAEALLLNRLDAYQQEFVPELVGTAVMEAAKFRVSELAADDVIASLEGDSVLNPPKRKR